MSTLKEGFPLTKHVSLIICLRDKLEANLKGVALNPPIDVPA